MPYNQKITLIDTRTQSFMIDYVITNRAIHPKNTVDVRTLSSTNVGSDHGLVLGKIKINLLKEKTKIEKIKERLNIESLEVEVTKIPYRLAGKLNNNDNLETITIWKQ